MSDRNAQLHFSNPQAYHDIYNALNRWDKARVLYASSFTASNADVDHSSFGFLGYENAKQRKDILQPLFSKKTIVSMQGLITEKVPSPFTNRRPKLSIID